jgi:hypothetical protein
MAFAWGLVSDVVLCVLLGRKDFFSRDCGVLWVMRYRCRVYGIGRLSIFGELWRDW